MKPIILIIILVALGTWCMQYLQSFVSPGRPVAFRELEIKNTAAAELVRWQW